MPYHEVIKLDIHKPWITNYLKSRNEAWARGDNVTLSRYCNKTKIMSASMRSDYYVKEDAHLNDFNPHK